MDWHKAKTPEKGKLDKLVEMAREDDLDGFYDDESMMEFAMEMMHTYLLCGVRRGEDVRKELDKGGDVFQHLPAGPMAFACVTLLNNYDLWTLMMQNVNDPSNVCHKNKGRLYTGSARGGGSCKTFKSR